MKGPIIPETKRKFDPKRNIEDWVRSCTMQMCCIKSQDNNELYCLSCGKEIISK